MQGIIDKITFHEWTQIYLDYVNNLSSFETHLLIGLFLTLVFWFVGKKMGIIPLVAVMAIFAIGYLLYWSDAWGHYTMYKIDNEMTEYVVEMEMRKR